MGEFIILQFVTLHVVKALKSGDLQKIVLSVINEKGPFSIREVLNEIKDRTKTDYAYSTIATIIRRLNKKGLVKAVTDEKTLKKYRIEVNAPQREVRDMMSTLIGRFGLIGARQLGEVFNSTLTDEELMDIAKEFEENTFPTRHIKDGESN